jgi:BirA family biotin operon repressor/biotin-[acetyl-CoA-carboxylase] ligase
LVPIDAQWDFSSCAAHVNLPIGYTITSWVDRGSGRSEGTIGLGDGKLAGILTEVVPVINGQALLIGIGINFYNQVDPQIATSLELLGVKGLKIHQAAALLADNLQISLKSFIQDGFSAFLKTWNERDYLLGRRIRIAVSNEEIVGSVFGVSQQGALLLQSGDLIREIWSGHITEIYPEIFKD